MKKDNITLAIRLFSVINTELPTSTDYQIALYLLENIQLPDILTIAALSEQCSVSKASISRFCRKIGLNDFFELREQIFRFKRETRRKLDMPFCGDILKMRRDFIDDMIAKLTIMRECMEDSKIDALVNDLKSGKTVTAMGHLQSGNTAMNMQYNLFVANKIIKVLTKSTLQTEYFRTANETDVAVIFSVSGDFMENLFYDVPKWNPGKKPKIYLFTANLNLSPKPYADVIYNCKTGFLLSGGNASLEIMQQLITLSYYYSV